MRFLFCLLCGLALALSTRAQTAAPPLDWQHDLTAALQLAQTSHKPVLAVFSGSDWCKPCIMLRQEVLDQPEFAAYARDRFILAHFDFPRSRKHQLPAEQVKLNEAAAARLNTEGTFPLVVLLAPDGSVLARTSYRPGGATAYVQHLTELTPKQ